jgi:hypothetical protein
MSASRKELVLGAVVVAMFVWSFIDSLLNLIQNPVYLAAPTLPGATATAMGWTCTLWAIGAIAIGAWLVVKGPSQVRGLAERLTIKAIIPGYYVFALVPLCMGAALIAAAHLTTWGWWLSCLSLPSVLLFLVLLLRARSGA